MEKTGISQTGEIYEVIVLRGSQGDFIHQYQQLCDDYNESSLTPDPWTPVAKLPVVYGGPGLRRILYCLWKLMDWFLSQLMLSLEEKLLHDILASNVLIMFSSESGILSGIIVVNPLCSAKHFSSIEYTKRHN